MKKCCIGILLAFSTLSIFAQAKETWKEQRSLLSFSAGISVPIICYAKTDISKNNFAGFAKPGFTLAINYGYYFGKNIGVTGKAFYASNKTNIKVLQSSGHDYYRYTGIMVGPLVTAGFSSKVNTDFKFMAGFAQAFSPKMVYHNTVLLNHDQSSGFIWSAAIDFRYNLSDKTFLTLTTNHTQLKPKFNNHSPAESLKDEQHIVVMNVDAGFGIKF